MRGFVAMRAMAAQIGSRLSARGQPQWPLMLIFSKDRAAQLDLFLRTFAIHVRNPPPITVLYQASSPAHAAAYEVAFRDYTGGQLISRREQSFRSDLIDLLGRTSAKNVMFFVDDIIFIRPVDTSILSGWDTLTDGVLSLRLGDNICSSFNAGNIPLQQPRFDRFERNNADFLAWRWTDSTLDWALPTSLDGHLLPVPELRQIIGHVPFKAPNSLEGAIGQYRFLFKWRRGVCYAQSRIVNLPLNSTKIEDFDFPHLDVGTDKLLGAFMSGFRLDASSFPTGSQVSCHMPWIPELKAQPSSSSHPPAAT